MSNRKPVVYPDTPTYRAWQKLIASGEPVCAAWRKDFVNFVADVGPEPSPEHFLTRRDTSVEHRLANTHWMRIEPPKPVAQVKAAANGLVRRAIGALRRRVFG